MKHLVYHHTIAPSNNRCEACPRPRRERKYYRELLLKLSSGRSRSYSYERELGAQVLSLRIGVVQEMKTIDGFGRECWSCLHLPTPRLPYNKGRRCGVELIVFVLFPLLLLASRSSKFMDWICSKHLVYKRTRFRYPRVISQEDMDVLDGLDQGAAGTIVEAVDGC